MFYMQKKNIDIRKNKSLLFCEIETLLKFTVKNLSIVQYCIEMRKNANPTSR